MKNKNNLSKDNFFFVSISALLISVGILSNSLLTPSSVYKVHAQATSSSSSSVSIFCRLFPSNILCRSSSSSSSSISSSEESSSSFSSSEESSSSFSSSEESSSSFSSEESSSSFSSEESSSSFSSEESSSSTNSSSSSEMSSSSSSSERTSGGRAESNQSSSTSSSVSSSSSSSTDNSENNEMGVFYKRSTAMNRIFNKFNFDYDRSCAPFDDTGSERITTLKCKGFISGVGDNKFMPSKGITKNELIKVLINVLASKDSKYADISNTTNPFSDVNTSDPFYNQTMSAYKYGLITTSDTGKFNGDDLIGKKEVRAIVDFAASLVV